MALLWIEGFEGYAAVYPSDPVDALRRRYSHVWQVGTRLRIATGRFSGYSLWGGFDDGSYIVTPSLTTDDTLTIGFALQIDQLGAGTYKLVSFYDGLTEGINLRYTSSGELAIYRGNTQLEVTTTLGLGIATWYYVEMQTKCHDTTGTYEVQVNSFVRLQGTGVDTKAGTNSYHDKVRLWSGYPAYTYDDMYILDSTGTDNTDILANSKVVPIYPNGDGSVAWTRSGGSTNYENVDEGPAADDDTTYVEDSATNNTDLYDYENVADLGDIFGVQINTDCAETDAESFDILTPMKLGGTQSDGSTMRIGISGYTTKIRIEEEDPDGLDWTMANLNATQFGIKVG